MYGLKQETIDKIQIILASHDEVEKAILYGSRAKGNYKPSSDVDLTLVGKSLNFDIVSKISAEIDDLLLPYIFDISVFHQISNPDLIEHINRVGKEFYFNKSKEKQ
jgi:type I restriction enzyme S subunit